MDPLHIISAQAITSVGLTATTTSASLRAGINRIFMHDLYLDDEGNPISVSPLPMADDDEGIEEPEGRMLEAATQSLRGLMQSFDAAHDRGRPCHLLLGVAHPNRDGALYESPDDPLPSALASELAPLFGAVGVEVFPQGNPSGMFALKAASEIIRRDRRSLCVVGAVDSLLDEDLLERLEEEERLKSEGNDCPHGLSPGEAVGFIAVESSGVRSPHRPLAVVRGVAVGQEPSPYVSEEPGVGEGLTEVCRQALLDADTDAEDLDAVLIDFDGEHHRALEWSQTEVRCLAVNSRTRALVHPAENYGSIGAASGLLMIAVVAASRRWLDGTNLVLASDDEGPRGAAIVRRHWDGS